MQNSSQADYQTELLNRVEAMCRCGVSTFTQLAKDMGCQRQNVYQWLTDRSVRPNGEATLRLQKWAARQSNRIAILGPQVQTAYRSEYRRICENRPVNGRKDL